MASADTIDDQFRRYLESKAPKDLAPIFQQLAPKLMAASRRAGLDETGAEDVVQETFLALIEAEDRFETSRPFLPWFYGIALRQIRAERRRRARIFQLLGSDGDEPLLELEQDSRGLGGPFPLEFRRKVVEAIGSLSEANQVVVRAALLGGQSNAEISESTGLSKGAVAVRLHRGLERLRTRLKDSLSLGALAAGSGGGRGMRSVWEGVLERGSASKPFKVAASASTPAAPVAAPLATLVAVGIALIGGAAWWVLGPRGTGPEESGSQELEGTTTAGQAVGAAFDPNSDSVALANTEPRAAIRTTEASLTAATTDTAGRPNPRVELVGRVVRTDGRPSAAGVEIFLLESNPNIVLPSAPLVPNATTGDDGSYRLPLGELAADPTPVLVARAPGEVAWADVGVDAAEAGELPVLRLTPELVIEATVKDTLGRPVPDVQLAAWTQAPRFLVPPPAIDRFGAIWTRPYYHLFGATTNDEGRASVRSLYGADTPGLIAVASAWKEGFAAGTIATRLKGGASVELDFALYRTEDLSLRGRIVDADGAPLRGAQVSFKRRGESDPATAPQLTVDSSGEWDVPAGYLDDFPLALRVEAEGFVAVDLLYEQAVDLPSDAVRVELARTRVLTGQVMYDTGEAAVGAEVRVSTAFMGALLTTDGEGRFRCMAPVGAPALLFVQSSAEEPVRRARGFSIANDEVDVRLTLASPKGVASQLAVALPAAPDGDTWLRAELASLSVKDFEGVVPVEELSGAVAKFGRVPTGSWLVYGVTEQGAHHAQEIEVGSESPEQPIQEVALGMIEPSGRIECHIARRSFVTSETGMVLARQAARPRLPIWMGRGQQEGRRELRHPVRSFERFVLPQLSPGEWEIFVQGDGWCTAPKVLTVPSGGDVRLDLEPVTSSAVELLTPAVDSDGIITIEARSRADEPWRQVAIDVFVLGEEGRLRVELPAESWQWRATMKTAGADGRFYDVFPRVVGTAETKSVRLLEAALADWD